MRKDRRFQPTSLESLESKKLLSAGLAPHAGAVHVAAAPTDLGGVRGTASLDAAGHVLTLNHGTGRLAGVGGIRLSGMVATDPAHGNLILTASRQRAYRLAVDAVGVQHHTTKIAPNHNVDVYDVAIDYHVVMGSDAAAPAQGKLVLTVRSGLFRPFSSSATYQGHFFPAAS